jgi:hypothetical protein
MPLKDLNEDLYNYNSKIVPTHTHEKSPYDPNMAASQMAASPFDEEQVWNKPQKGLSPKQKKLLWITIGVVSVIILIVTGFFAYRWWQKNAFHQDRVGISFEGPTEADSTQVNKYIIHFKNNNRVTLQNAEIQLTYSENFQPIDNVNLKFISTTSSRIFIGDIKPNSEGTTELKGIFYAPKDVPVYVYASLHFTPSNGTDELSVENQVGVNITAAPVVLNITAPDQTVDGYKITNIIDYKNLDVRRMSGVQIRVDFPEGFQLVNAQPKPSEKNSNWYIGDLEADQGGKITIEGKLYGGNGENKTMAVSLGHVGSDGSFVVFNKQEYTTNIVLPVLSVKQSLQSAGGNPSDFINAGDILNYIISYKNTSDISIRNAIITAQITGKVLDFSKIKVEKGFYDGKNGTITWKASDVPGLANIDPQNGGTVSFSIPVKSVIPVERETDKNFVVASIAKIDSPDIPVPNGKEKIIGSDELDLKLASKVLFNTTAFYNDSKIKNSGPIPLKVGTETTFSVHWTIVNVSNDISNAKIVSSLPSGIRWTGKIFPANERIYYDARTNQIVWDIGNLRAGTGILNSPHEVVFQIGVTPQANQVGEPVGIVNQSTFTAKDDFVSRDISIQNDAKDTQLYEDSAVGSNNGKVSQ